MSNTQDSVLEIAKIGKPVGLDGFLKLNLLTDFPKQFKKGKIFNTATNKSLKVASFNEARLIIKFEGYDTPEDASMLTNQLLVTTIEDSKKNCKLEKDEFFWFDIVGCDIVEQDETLGVIVEIDRFGGGDFLRIDTNEKLVLEKLPKTFILPFIDHFIGDIDIASKKVFVKGARDILEAS